MWLKTFFAPRFLVQCLPGAQSSLTAGDHRTRLDGVELWYKIAGHSQPGQAPVLFLHGGPGYNSFSFERTIGAQLETHMQMIYLDERGSGRSERPPDHDYSMKRLVGDVEALRVSLGLQKLTLMGHSFGGTIALEYAARYPQHVQKLIILDGAADMPATFALWRTEVESRYPSEWRSTIDGSAGERLKRAQAQNDGCDVAKAEFGAEMETLQRVDNQAFHNWQQFHNQTLQMKQSKLDEVSGLRNTGEVSAAYFGSQSQFPCYRFTAYSRLTMPTLIMVGNFDGAIGVEQMQALAGHLPNARLDRFKDSGHFVYAEEPNKFIRDLDAFLKASTRTKLEP